MEELAFWRNVALVILAVEGLFVLVILLALNYGIVRLMDFLHRKSTVYTRKAQQISRVVAERTDAYAERAVRPIVAVRARATRVRESAKSLLPRRPSHRSASLPGE